MKDMKKKELIVNKEIEFGKIAYTNENRKSNLVTLRVGLTKHSESDKLDIYGKKLNGYYSLGISASVYNQTKTYIVAGGQCLDELIKHESLKSSDLFVKLYNIWKRWHLNDLHAGLKVQTDFIKDNIKEYDYTRACRLLKAADLYEINGYKYGHGWLVEELPSEVVEFIKGL